MVHYKVCLRIGGEGLDTNKVTSELGVDPTKVVRAGDKGALGPAPIPVWMWEARTDSGSEKWNELEAGLQRVISVFGSRKEALQKLSCAGKCYSSADILLMSLVVRRSRRPS